MQSYCCVVNHFSTIFKLTLLEHDLEIVKWNTHNIGSAQGIVMKISPCRPVLLAVLSLLGEVGLGT